MKQTIAFLLLISLVFTSCNDDSSPQSTITNDRPHDPWVFRSVLDERPRNITFALTDDIWAAYDTEHGALYKIWGGTVAFEGAVYDHKHGPQPMSIGNAYFINQFKNPWFTITPQGDTLALTVQYLGHKINGNKASLNYSLSDDEDQIKILVEEVVDASSSESGQPIFNRSYASSGVPDGYQLVLKTNVHSIVAEQNINTNGTLEIVTNTEVDLGNGKSALDLSALLILVSNDITNFDITLLNTPLIDNPNITEGEEPKEIKGGIHDGLKLIAKSDCKTCHNKNLKTIGPSYTTIAEKYENTSANVSMLSNKIKNGGTGIWGNQIMTPHPDLPMADIEKMVDYILSLNQNNRKSKEPVAAEKLITYEGQSLEGATIMPGLMTKIYNLPKGLKKLPEITNEKPIFAGILKNLDNIRNDDFKELDENFMLVAEGFLYIEEDGKYNIELWSDDGSKVYLNDQLTVDNDGLHGTEKQDQNVFLTKGYHKLKVEYFNGLLGKFLSLNWIKPGEDQAEVIPKFNLCHDKSQEGNLSDLQLPMSIVNLVPGDGQPVDGVHPSFDLAQARPEAFKPKVGGLDFLSDGSMIVCVWDAAGSVYKITNAQSGDSTRMEAIRIGFGLAEPLGLRIVDDRIFVMQKQEMTELIDNDNDGMIDEYKVLSNDWKVSANFHEFGFGLAHKDDYLYATLATGIQPGGASVVDQIPDRGKVLKVNIKTGETSFVASGLRTPNGIGIGFQDELFVADNEGDWLPSSKILHVTEGAWFGSRSVDFEGTADLEEKKPVVWLPQNEIGNSPSTPLALNLGPYQNQMIHGEVTHGGVKRVFVEEVDGELQGVVFRFTQGIEGGVNRMVWGPDGALYLGCIGNPGNWAHAGSQWYGLQKMTYNGNPVFEMLAVRAKSNGLEIEFTQPLKKGDGWNPKDYLIKQWYYQPTENYGGPKLEESILSVKSATVYDDRTKVFLELEGMKEGHVVYINLQGGFISEPGQSLWSTEAWYTMNNVPKSGKGIVKPAPEVLGNNILTETEKGEGWKLLFDGKSMDQFRNFKSDKIGSSWIIDDEAIHLNAVLEDGHWQAKDGGDIITKEVYENFEFKIDWKISNCGNSGIIFNVVESDEYDFVWQTGPEMQVLDDVCHPDTRYPKHNAGDLYDMMACKYPTVRPAGEWNNVIIRSIDGKVDFYLNGYVVVSFDMRSSEWKDMIANSKFKDMPGFGLVTKGHLALQDHGDKVWFRNIKIKKIE